MCFKPFAQRAGGTWGRINVTHVTLTFLELATHLNDSWRFLSYVCNVKKKYNSPIKGRVMVRGWKCEGNVRENECPSRASSPLYKGLWDRNVSTWGTFSNSLFFHVARQCQIHLRLVQMHLKAIQTHLKSGKGRCTEQRQPLDSPNR